MSRPRRLLLASLTGSERRGKLHPERPASCRRSIVSGDRRLLLASLTGSERRGRLHPERPASCRRSVVSGDRRLRLASLTGSERRGKLHPERPASCRRSDPMMPILQKSAGNQAVQVGPKWAPCQNVPYAHPSKSRQNLIVVFRFILI